MEGEDTYFEPEYSCGEQWYAVNYRVKLEQIICNFYKVEITIFLEDDKHLMLSLEVDLNKYFSCSSGNEDYGISDYDAGNRVMSRVVFSPNKNCEVNLGSVFDEAISSIEDHVERKEKTWIVK